MVLLMGIFDRMGKVISSNFNSLLDSADDPSKSVDLTLGEMRDQVRAARQEVVSSVAAEKQPGACSNYLTDEVPLDVPSGTHVANGIPVEVVAVPA